MDILPGMVPASYRGVAFFAPDTATEVGRRIAEHLFPGIDVAAYDDHGLLPDVISLQGILVGDDYVAQATALKRAFKTPGPATLVHPWEGPMTVIMTDPAEISFDSTELRVARFVATFRRVTLGARLSGGISTASRLVAAASALSSAAGVLSASTAQNALSIVRSKSLGRGFRIVSSVWRSVADTGDAINGLPVRPPAIGGRAASLITAALPSSTPTSATDLQAVSVGLTDSLVNLVPELAEESAIAPAADAPPVPIGLASGVAAAVAIYAGNALAISTNDAPSPTDRVHLVAAAGEALAAAARISIAIDHESRREAQTFRAGLTDALDIYSEAIEPLAATAYATPASALARTVSELKASAIADINEAIGRLPDVLVFTPERDLDAALLAQHVYGDSPDQLEAGYRAIVGRNRPKHPARLPAGPIEVLK